MFLRFLHRVLEALSNHARYRREHPCAWARECRNLARWAEQRGWKRVQRRWTNRAKRWEAECKRIGGKDPCDE